MTADLDEIRNLVGPYDPASTLCADPAAAHATLTRILARRRSPRRPTRWAVVVAVGAVALGAVVFAPFAPKRAEALSFHRYGKYIDVKILNPTADPARYRREFAAHGLNVDLRLEASSPSLVGTLISVESSGRDQVTALGGGPGCGQVWCQAGVRIPVGTRGRLALLFGRAPRPGEAYVLTGDPTARGEALAGLTLRGRTLADVTPRIRQRGVTIVKYLAEPPADDAGSRDWNFDDHVLRPDQVSGAWYVYDAFTGHARNTVELLVSPTPPDASE